MRLFDLQMPSLQHLEIGDAIRICIHYQNMPMLRVLELTEWLNSFPLPWFCTYSILRASPDVLPIASSPVPCIDNILA